MNELVIRPCGRGDLRALEWVDGAHDDRALIRWVFERARHGQMMMLVAACGRELVGQIWIDFGRKLQIAVLWALRVKPAWQGRGVGTLLIAISERLARADGARISELCVELDNPRARRFYEHLGYRQVVREPAVDAITGEALGFALDVMHWPLVPGDARAVTSASAARGAIDPTVIVVPGGRVVE